MQSIKLLLLAIEFICTRISKGNLHQPENTIVSVEIT